MASLTEVVEKLRPLHPPAPDGTLEILVMAIVGGVLGIAAALILLHVSPRRKPLRRASLRALAASRRLPATERLVAQARVLRAIAATVDRGAVSLQGEAWLTRLDAIFSTRFFSDGLGRVFGEALYRPRDDDPSDALHDELERLLTRLQQ